MIMTRVDSIICSGMGRVGACIVRGCVVGHAGRDEDLVLIERDVVRWYCKVDVSEECRRS